LLYGIEGFPSEKTYVPQNTRGGYSNSRNVHMGQRKLLISKVQFLTNVYNMNISKVRGVGTFPRYLVVYAGACPCLHLDELIAMYKHVDFLLVDPAFNDHKNSGCFTRWDSCRVSVCAEIFNDHTVTAINSWCAGDDEDTWVHRALDSLGFCQADFDGSNLLFISDIRLDARNELKINNDMQLQARWLQNLNASHSLFKFRLPYYGPRMHSKPYKYLDGEVYLPVFGPRSTTECRLHVDRCKYGYKYKDYNPEEHERVMAGFNSTNRANAYQYNGKIFPSFDFASEAIILDKYRKCMSVYSYPVIDPYRRCSIQPTQSLNFWNFDRRRGFRGLPHDRSNTQHELHPGCNCAYWPLKGFTRRASRTGVRGIISRQRYSRRQVLGPYGRALNTSTTNVKHTMLFKVWVLN